MVRIWPAYDRSDGAPIDRRSSDDCSDRAFLGFGARNSGRLPTINPKVLWITRTKGYGRMLTIRGQRLDAVGSFSATYPGFGDYPSYVNFPYPAACE
jgi:hypothetical protein